MHRRDVFECSELERAASCVCTVSKILAQTAVNAQQRSHAHTSATTTTGIVVQTDPEISALVRSLEQRKLQVTELLLGRIREHLLSILSSVSAHTHHHPGTNTGTGTGTSKHTAEAPMVEFPTRSWKHLVRALSIMQRTDIVASVFAEAVTTPIAKTALTAGRSVLGCVCVCVCDLTDPVSVCWQD
jgi:hypothetical protein